MRVEIIARLLKILNSLFPNQAYFVVSVNEGIFYYNLFGWHILNGFLSPGMRGNLIKNR